MKFKYFLLPLVILFSTANAQEWPNKPIKIISPYPAGGSNDSVTRLISEKLSPKLKQTITVENFPGKDGTIASEIVAKSKPDGYNFVMLASPHTANHHFYEKLPYETLTEFTPIDGSKMVMIKPSLSVFDTYNERYKDAQPLFKIYKNQSVISPVATVKYKGVTYSIADDDQSYSKDVMEFMSTLVTVAKIPGAIPPSPAVIVR
jgi:tripartite-type tricarboxylate transporter receptor subunit TctC